MALSNQELIQKTVNLRAQEKEVLYELLVYLGELDSRGLYRDEGYSSFYSYLTDGLGYSEGAAYRRVQGARTVTKFPKMYEALIRKELSFTALIELSSIVTEDNIEEILAKCAGKSKEEVRAVLAELKAPEVQVKPKERVRRVKAIPKAAIASEDSLFTTRDPENSATSANTPTATAEVTPPTESTYEVTLQVDDEFMALYREAKAIAGGHSMKEVFAKLLKDFTQRKSPKHRTERRLKRQKSKSAQPQSSAPPLSSSPSYTWPQPSPPSSNAPQPANSRYIPQPTKDQVYLRDRGQCTYTSPTGTRCTCKQNLEYDHIKPYSLGGESTVGNLRLLCRAHNQLMAERVLGKEFMESKRGA